MPHRPASEPLSDLLEHLRIRHGVAGATLGVLQDGRIEAVASGLLNIETGVECTLQSVFQIGSIGKIFTTTLVMQLVDEGRLSLDDRVVRHLPDFAIGDARATRSLTVRQLLNHTSGMDGDFFPPDDPEGPSTASYVRKMNLLPSLNPPGSGPMAYCNSGFVTAGRIVEALTGTPWQTAVQDRICARLGMTHFFAYPQQALRYRCAMGHVHDPKEAGQLRRAPATYLPLSAAPAGTVLSMSVQDVLKFAAAHMANGACSDGSSLLSAASAGRMQTDTMPIPPFSRLGVTHWGLGWFVCDGHGYRMIGHDGATLGQFAYLRAFPDQGVAFALLTNSPSRKMFDELEAHLMQALLKTGRAPQPPRAAWTPDPRKYVGTYANIAATYDVAAQGDVLAIDLKSRVIGPDTVGTLEPYCEDVFTLHAPGSPVDGDKVSFHGGEDGAPHPYFRIGLRIGRRTAR